MILGIGIDVVSLARMRRALSTRWSDKFLVKVFTQAEIDTCKNAPDPAQSFAARFAAKEAVAKALGSGFSKGVTARDIIVVGGENKKPQIKLVEKSAMYAESIGIGSIHISMSHVAETACAMAVAESAC